MGSLESGTERYRGRHPERQSAGVRQGLAQSVSGPVAPQDAPARSHRDAYRETHRSAISAEDVALRRLQAKARAGTLSDEDAERLARFAAQYVDNMERLQSGRQL